MKGFLTILLLISIFSCTTNTQEPQPGIIIPDFPSVSRQEPAIPGPAQALPTAINDASDFDPSSISRQEFEDAKSEIELLVEEINRVIRAKNYTQWLTYLSDDYIAAINSPEYLDRISKTSRQLTMQKIVLKTPRDYFTHVAVAARANISTDAHLDDIEFMSHTRVKAFAIKGNQRLRLFEFVKDKGAWKIAFSD